MKVTNREEFGWGIILGICGISMILVAVFATGGWAAGARAVAAVVGAIMVSLGTSTGINGIADEHNITLT